VKIDWWCQKFSKFAIKIENRKRNIKKWGVAESLRANPILFRFVFVAHVSFIKFCFRRVLVWWSEATPLVYNKHTPNCHL